MMFAFLERGCSTFGCSRKVRRVKNAKRYDALAYFENVLKLKLACILVHRKYNAEKFVISRQHIEGKERKILP